MGLDKLPFFVQKTDFDFELFIGAAQSNTMEISKRIRLSRSRTSSMQDEICSDVDETGVSVRLHPFFYPVFNEITLFVL